MTLLLSDFPEVLRPLAPKLGEWSGPKYPKLHGGLTYHVWMSSNDIATFAALQPFASGAQEIVMYVRGNGGRLSFPLITELVGKDRTRVGSARESLRHQVLWGHYTAIMRDAELAA
ncbi:MAG TPA: hypothetical protein VLG40_05320 [Candidatus Saccharimonas sp.]|nr:hypothetical protein [Candidatus Saccharimonas sp.]